MSETEVVPFSMAHLSRMDIQPAHAWIRPHMFRNFLVVSEALCNAFSWSMLVDGEPKLVAGVTDEGVGWAFLAADMRGCMVRATREARHVLFSFAEFVGPVHADIDISSKQAIRWAVALGFKPTGDGSRWIIER